jgi:hypothetical protein
VITLTRTRDVGPILRGLRHRAGLSANQVAARVRISKSGVAKRETQPGCTLGALIDHAAALGYAVALVPAGRARIRLASADFAIEYDLLRTDGLSRKQIATRLHMSRSAIDAAYIRAVRAGLLTPDRRTA